jgi:hypothetical protein
VTAREERAPAFDRRDGAPGGAAPLRHWGARRRNGAAGRVMVRQGAPLRTRRLPALHIPRLRGSGKREGRARRPKIQVSGRRSVGCQRLFDRRRQAKLARSAGVSPAQVRPSKPPGSECCVRRRRRRTRSVHSGCVGCVIEPRNGLDAGAEIVVKVECNMSNAVMRGTAALPGSKSTSRAKGSRRNLGGPAPDQRYEYVLARIGKARSRSR